MNQLNLKEISIVSSKMMLDPKINNYSDDPFKHFFVDNFFEDNLANGLLENFQIWIVNYGKEQTIQKLKLK